MKADINTGGQDQDKLKQESESIAGTESPIASEYKILTNDATDLSSTEATLNGLVNANNDTIKIIFEYGLTNAYGSTVNR